MNSNTCIWSVMRAFDLQRNSSNEPASYIFAIVLTIRFWQRFLGTPGKMAPWLKGRAHVCVSMTHTGGSVSVILQGPCGFSRH